MRRKPAKVKRRNAAAKALASPRYRQRRISDKRKAALRRWALDQLGEYLGAL